MEYKTENVCATHIKFDLIDGRLHNVHFQKGCPGNLQAIQVLVEGMKAEEVIKKLRGIQCGDNSTSCADQLAQAIEKKL